MEKTQTKKQENGAQFFSCNIFVIRTSTKSWNLNTNSKCSSSFELGK